MPVLTEQRETVVHGRRGRHTRRVRSSGVAGLLAVSLVAALLTAGSAGAATVVKDPGRWRLVAKTSVPLVYFQGMTQDNQGHLYFDGIDNGLYATDDRLQQLAQAVPAIPTAVTKSTKYNHVGAIAFDKKVGVLLPMECYDTSTGANCADTGAIGVAAPLTLDWRYEVKLDASTIKKAMWAAVSPDGTLLWTSSGSNLLAYRMSDIDEAHAWPAHPAVKPVRILRGAVPPSGVTGATFYHGRLFLAGNVGNDDEVWSVDVTTGSRRLEISREMVGESEGLDVVTLDGGKVHSVDRCQQSLCMTATKDPDNVFGGVLHWMIMPIASGKTPPTYSAPTILSFVPR